MKYMKLLALVSILAVSQIAFSSDAEAQTSPMGTYTLTEVNGQALPVTIESRADCYEEVVSGTLMLQADGDWDFDYVERKICGSQVVEEDHEEEDGEYSYMGNSIRFSDDTETYDPNDIEIDELKTGTLDGDRLMVTLEDGQTVLTFRRT